MNHPRADPEGGWHGDLGPECPGRGRGRLPRGRCGQSLLHGMNIKGWGWQLLF